jgi:DNA mismatch repair ATPase MutL
MGIYPSRSASTESTVPIPVPDSAEWSAVEEQVNQQLRRRRQNKADQTEAGNDATPAEEKPSEEKPVEEKPSEEASKENQEETNESSGEDSDDECEEEEIDPKLMIAVFRRPKCERCAAVLDILLAPNDDDESSEEEEEEENNEEEEEEEERGVPSVITNLFIVIFLIHLMQLFIKMTEPVPRYVFY